MARDITVTFDDGSSHVYENAPDDVTFEKALSRAQSDFSSRTISNIDGGRAPSKAAPKVETKAKAAPVEDFDTTDAMGADLGSAIMGAAGKPRSVLEGQQMPVPEEAVRAGVNPNFIAQVQAQLDALPADKRQAALENLQAREDVYGRAAKTITGRYAAMDKGVSPTLTNVTDRRLEQQKERFMSQGLNAEEAEGEARKQALMGRTRRDLAQMNRDIVGEQADAEAAKQAEEFKNAGFWERVGGETKSRATQTGMGLMNIYADLTGDEQMGNDLRNARRVEEARGEAIPKGEGIFEKSAQGAMTSLATQGPMMVLGALTGTAVPVLAQAGIDVFGSEYGQGRAKGLSPAEASTRAGLMASAEILFERYGLAENFKAIKGALNRVPTDQVAAYLAKAVAKEIPSEQLTSAVQFAIDKAPGIGLNPNAGWKDFLENQAETFRQTVLQAGATSAGVIGVNKAAQGIGKLLPEQEQREGYERDLSYTGLADMMAREKGFLTPEAKATPPVQETVQPAPTAEVPVEETAPVPVADQIKEQKIAELSKRIESRGVDPEEAIRIAAQQVESDDRQRLKQEEEAAAEVPSYYPKEKNNRLNEIFLELVDQGIPPNKAQLMAGQQLAAEKEDRKIAAAQTRYLKKAKKDATAQAETTGAEDAGQPIDETSGVGAELAGQPSEVIPTGGVAGAEADRVVRAGEDVGVPDAREGQQPTALTEETPTTEGADVGTQTIEAVEAETQGQEPAAAPAAEVTEAAPKGKRGRPALAPEQKAASEEKRKQQRADFKAADKQVKTAEDLLNEAITPINEEEMDTDEQVKSLEEDNRRKKNAAIRTLYDISKANRGAPGKRAAEALKNSAITPRELADAAASHELRKKQGMLKNALGGENVGEPDDGFSKLTNGAQAIARITKTGNAFEKLLAKRISAFVRNVKFVVIEEGQDLPAQLQTPKNAKAWEGARGLFIENDATGERVVYVRGASFGEDQGVNNVTVLHELLHAATNQKLYLGLTAIKQGFSSDAPLTNATKDLLRTMRNAQDAYLKLKAVGKAPAEIEDLVSSTRGEIFGLPHEFLAYGMSDPTFQNFLMEVQGEEEDTSFFTQFVTAIREFFKMGDDTTNALTDLIVASDKILSAQKDARMRFLEKANQALAQREGTGEKVSANVKPGTLSKTAQVDLRNSREVQKDVAIALEKVNLSRTAEEMAKNTSVAEMATDPNKFLGVLRRAYAASTYQSRRFMLNGVTTDFLVEWAGNDIPELKNTNRYIQSMHGMTARLMEGAGDVSTTLFNVLKVEPTQQTAIENVALTATLSEIDPSTDRRSATLNKLWDALTPAGRRAYIAIRDWYNDMSSLYSTLLDDQIKGLSVSSIDKDNLLTKLKGIYEVGNKISPYFALVRRGNYWLRVGGGKNRQFYMFNTMQERDKVAEEMAAKMRTSVDELMSDRVFQMGNDVRSLRLNSFSSSPMLTELFDLIDNMKVANKTPEEIAKEKESIKDSVYQLYLMSMPDQSFRKQFISREGITGFTTDLLQNFSDSATTMSIQLSRIKYASKIRTSLSAANDSVAERPSLHPFIEEMGERVALELPGMTRETKVGQVIEGTTNLATRMAFIHYLSGLSSAILQPISIVQFALPLLGARHGYTETAREMSKMLAVWNAYGISKQNSDGTVTYIMPTVRSSDAVAKSPMEVRALQQMIGRNVGQVTLSSEMLQRKDVPTEKSLSKTRRYAKTSWDVISGGLFMHSAERIAQEIVYLTSFRLSRAAALNKFRKSNAYKGATSKGQAVADFEKANFQNWVDQAVIDTHESLGNMAAENRPPVMRSAGGKLMLQFYMFPVHATILLGKNFFKMVKPWKQEKRWEATKIFFGTMGMTAVLGGAVALPIVYTLLGFLSGMWRDERENLPADLREMDFQTWFRQKFLPEQLGNEWAAVVDRGLLNYATGVDFSSRLSLSNMWLREGKETKTPRDATTQWIIDHLGASVSQGLAYTDGVKALMDGDYQKAVEKFAPASIRNFALTFKYAQEGAKDTKGAQLMTKDEFKTGELLWQTVGFRSDLLANTQETNFRMIGLQQRVDNERNSLLTNLDLHYRKNDLKQYGQVWKKIEEFNTKYPWNPITSDNIQDALEKRQEARGKSWRGFEVNQKNAPYSVEGLQHSRERIRERGEETQK